MVLCAPGVFGRVALLCASFFGHCVLYVYAGDCKGSFCRIEKFFGVDWECRISIVREKHGDFPLCRGARGDVSVFGVQPDAVSKTVSAHEVGDASPDDSSGGVRADRVAGIARRSGNSFSISDVSGECRDFIFRRRACDEGVDLPLHCQEHGLYVGDFYGGADGVEKRVSGGVRVGFGFGVEVSDEDCPSAPCAGHLLCGDSVCGEFVSDVSGSLWALRSVSAEQRVSFTAFHE